MDRQSVTAVLEMAAPKIRGEGEQKAIREIIAVGRKFEDRRTSIEVDLNLSEQGKKNALIAARQEAEAELSVWMGAKIGRLDEAILNTTAAVERAASPNVEPPDVTDSMGIKAALRESRRESRRAEIRRGLEGLNDLEVEAVYFGAVDPEVREALETAPYRIRRGPDGGVFSGPLLTSEQIARQRMGRASSVAPEIVSQLRSFQDSRASLSHFAAVLGTSLRKAVPLGPSDPVTFKVDGKDMQAPKPKNQ